MQALNSTSWLRLPIELKGHFQFWIESHFCIRDMQNLQHGGMLGCGNDHFLTLFSLSIASIMNTIYTLSYELVYIFPIMPIQTKKR